MVSPFRNIMRGEAGELLRLGMPIVIGQLGIIMVSFADTMMVGWYGTEELGAAAFVNNLFNLVIIFATGFSYGITPIVGALFGRGERLKIGGVLRNALFLSAMVSMVLMALMMILYLNLHRLGQPEELLGLMRPYFVVLLLSLPFVMLFNAFKQFSEGITDTKTPAGRWGNPEDLAGPAVFLASSASDFVNGHILYVDGGILAYIGKQPK